MAVALCLSLPLEACSNDTGYVEIKTGPLPSAAQPSLYLDTTRVEPRKGAAVLRRAVGTARLQIAAGGQMILLCEIAVRKNRITTVAVSLFDRPPRCQCRTDVIAEQRGARICLG
jgi:hypothetical protein